MLIRTYADIQKLKGKAALSPAEKKLIKNCKLGEPTVLGDGTRPDGPSPERIIRADLLRYLILGGCEQCRVHEHGVILTGAWIEGELNVRLSKTEGSVYLCHCSFDTAFAARQAELNLLVLTGSRLPALDAQGAIIRGDIFLNKLRSDGEVSLCGTEIGGQLTCIGAELSGGNGAALNVQAASLKGGVFLGGLTTDGEVSFSGATIGGQFNCVGAKFNGAGGKALNGQRMVVRDGFYWKGVELVHGVVDLSSARFADLVDDKHSWDLVLDLRLAGATYENLVGPLDLEFRKQWLRKGASFKGQFHPQPYQQLAKFYRETGHRHEAREILIEKEREQRKAVRASIRKGTGKSEYDVPFSVKIVLSWLWNVTERYLSFNVWRRLRIGWNWFCDILIRYIAGYGYKPWLSLIWLAVLIGIFWTMACYAWNAGDFAPNSAIVLTSPEWKALADLPEAYTSLSDDSKRMIVEDMTPAHPWTETHAPGKDYETFYSFAYALDVVVPVLDLGQTDAWAPSPARGDWGHRLFYLQKMFIVAGWVVTAIAAAAISGMIRRDD